MASYFKLTTGMSRGIEDGASKKTKCSWLTEFFCLSEAGLQSVNVCEDGFLWKSPLPTAEQAAKQTFRVPARALPATEAEYLDAHQRWEAKEAAKKEQAAKEKAFLASLKKGMSRAAHAAEEAGAAEPVLVESSHFLDDFTVLDLEFQGTDLLELGAIRYQRWQPAGQLQSFVQFRGELSYHVSKLTGIEAKHVRNAPEPRTVLQQFRQMAGDSLLVCHNLSADRRVLEAVRTRLGATAPLANPWFCTLALAKQRLPGRKHGLGELCQEFGIACHGAHRALRDAQMCAGLLHHLHQLEPINGPLLPAKARKLATQPSLFQAA